MTLAQYMLAEEQQRNGWTITGADWKRSLASSRAQRNEAHARIMLTIARSRLLQLLLVKIA